MSLQAVSASFSSASFAAIGASAMAGDILPSCTVCGCYACQCTAPTSVYNVWDPYSGIGTGGPWTATWTCAGCGASMPLGTAHHCVSQVSTPIAPNPYTFTYIEVRECALCDQPLALDDKKVCKGCKAVFEAWKFLTAKPEPEPEKEE